MFRVAVLDDYQQVALKMANWKTLEPEGEVQAFADNLVDVPRLAERLHTFEAVVLMRERTPFPRALLDRLPNLRLIVTAGMRNASIDVAAATEKGVLVTGTDMLEIQEVKFVPPGRPVAEKQSPRLQRVFNNRHIETLFRDFASIKFFLARDAIREVLVVR